MTRRARSTLVRLKGLTGVLFCDYAKFKKIDNASFNSEHANWYEMVMTLLIWLPPRCGHLDRGGDALYILDQPMTW